jgi:hypothetical protein
MIAWHYTTGEKFALIAESGHLTPATLGVEPPELPIVWFSINQYFENSAKKAVETEDGSYRSATLSEMHEHADGLYRFGYPIQNLKCGEPLRKAAKMKSIVWRFLAKRAKVMKANSLEWFGHVGENLSIEGMRIEVMGDDLKWKALGELQCARPAEAVA